MASGQLHQIFISYSRVDLDKAVKIQREIEGVTPYKCWIDLDGIYSGTMFEDKIMTAIRKSDMLIFLMSENSMLSEWTQRELRFANQVKKHIIPVNIDGCEPKDWFMWFLLGKDIISYSSEVQWNKLLTNLNDTISESSHQVNNNFSEREEDQAFSILRINELLDRVKSGDVQSMYELGCCYKDEYLRVAESRPRYSEEALDDNQEMGSGIHSTIKSFEDTISDCEVFSAEQERMEQNAKNAFEWLKKAGDLGHAAAYYELVNRYNFIDDVIGFGAPTPKTLIGIIINTLRVTSKGSKLRKEFMTKSAIMGFPPAQYLLANDTISKKKSFTFMQAAAVSNYGPAQLRLAEWYDTKRTDKVSYADEAERIEKAEYWYSKAAENGYNKEER